MFSCLVNDNQKQLVVLQKRIYGVKDVSDVPLPENVSCDQVDFVEVYPNMLQDVASNFLVTMQVAYTGEEVPLPVQKIPIQSAVADGRVKLHVESERLQPDSASLTDPVAFLLPARRDYRLWIPSKLSTERSSAVRCPLDVFTLNTTKMAGKCIVPKPNAFRWDLVAEVKFPELRIMRHYSCADWAAEFNCNMHLQTDRTVATQSRRKGYIGGDGSRFLDKTNLRVVTYQEFGLSTIPLVCNCYITKKGSTEPYHFGSEIGGCTFEEKPGKILMKTQNGRRFVIDPSEREVFDAREYVYFETDTETDYSSSDSD